MRFWLRSSATALLLPQRHIRQWVCGSRAKPALQRHPLFLEGKVEVQDEGSQLLAYLVAPRRREMVVDFCAGAGGKTLALGALMHSEGRVYAFDTAEKRLSNLKPRLRRSGLSNVHPQLIAGAADARVKRLTSKIDRVLVDAPCSGLGTLRRNPDLKWRQGPQAVTEMAAKQRAILDAAARLVKPGGRLVYATCSLLQEENEAVVDAFLDAHPRFARVHCGDILRRQGIELDTGAYFRVFPHTHGMDAFFRGRPRARARRIGVDSDASPVLARPIVRIVARAARGRTAAGAESRGGGDGANRLHSRRRRCPDRRRRVASGERPNPRSGVQLHAPGYRARFDRCTRARRGRAGDRGCRADRS